MTTLPRPRALPSRLAVLASLLTVAALACTSNHAATKGAALDAPPIATVAPADVHSAAPVASAAPEASPPDAAKAPPAPLAGQDFIEQARTLFRLAACGGDAPIPPRFDPKTIEAHCKDLTAKYADYKAQWVDVAMPYIAKLRPPGLPTEVVYPFGGGDLMTALATFPDGLAITTISLESAGDIRRADTITQKKLDAEPGK